jgi:hypothetical protein
MSTQTPQTDAIALRLPIGELRRSFDYDSIKQYNDLLALSRTLEADRDHYKALCEELRTACEEAATYCASDPCGTMEHELQELRRIQRILSAALKKAKKDI